MPEPTSASNAVVRNRTGSGGPSPSKVFDFESKNIKLMLHSVPVSAWISFHDQIVQRIAERMPEPTSASNAVVRNRTGSGGPSPSKVFDFESKNIKLMLHSVPVSAWISFHDQIVQRIAERIPCGFLFVER